MLEESTGVAVVVADLPGGQLLCFTGGDAVGQQGGDSGTGQPRRRPR